MQGIAGRLQVVYFGTWATWGLRHPLPESSIAPNRRHAADMPGASTELRLQQLDSSLGS